MATQTKGFKLPEHFDVERELLEQFSNRPGHQRCVEGRDELLLVVHEVPQPAIPEREALYFWKRRDGRWTQSGGPGLSELSELLDRYAQAIDGHEGMIDEADTAAEIFGILRHSGPLARSSRNLVLALEQTLAADHDNRDIRACRDRARELERAADLLHADARVTLEFWQAERSEEHSRASARLGRIAFRMNLLAGFFMPLMALSSLFGMNVSIPGFALPFFWGILLLGMCIGGVLLWLVGRQTGKRADFEDELGDEDDPKM
jgi:Mg2+ and Co2+ transporter CorA